MEKVSSDIYGSVGPATLHESRGQIRSERLPAMGLVSLPACPAAQANPPRPCSGLRLTRVDPSASPSASLRASAHRDDKKGLPASQTTTFMPGEGINSGCISADIPL